MQERIIKWCGRNVLAFCSGTYFLLDYSVCGSDPILISKLRLLEKLIERHFNVVYTKAYMGLVEMQYR